MVTSHQDRRTHKEQGQERADPRFARLIAQSNPCVLQASLQTVTTCLNWREEMSWAKARGKFAQDITLLRVWKRIVWGKDIPRTTKKMLSQTFLKATYFRFSTLSSSWGLTTCPLSHGALRAVCASFILTSQTQGVKERASWITCFCLARKMKKTQPQRMNVQAIPFLAA